MLAAVTATLLPAAAHATTETPATKLDNVRPIAIGDTCRVGARLPTAAPSFATSRPGAEEGPSALDRMRMSQEHPAPVAAIVPAEGPALMARATTIAFPQAVVPPRINCLQSPSADAMPAIDADSELGTLAIPVESTRFDDRWARVSRAPATPLMRAQLRRAEVTSELGEAATLDRINRWVNRHIAYVADESNYRQRDFWATAAETVSRGSGDCEDFAILKMQMLRAAGIADDRVKLVLLRDLALNADHAFLLVRSDAGLVVLDNMTDQIYDGRQSDAMRPILSFSGDRRWAHGYRDGPAPVEIAVTLAAAKTSSRDFASASSVATDRLLFKTMLAGVAPTRLGMAQLAIASALPDLFSRLPSRGAR